MATNLNLDGSVIKHRIGVSASLEIPQGAHIVVKTTGTGQNYAALASDAANVRYLGIAEDLADNSTGANGAKNVTFYKDGAVKCGFTGSVTTADIGRMAYVASSTELTTASGSNSVKVGVIWRLEPGVTSSTTASVYLNKGSL